MAKSLKVSILLLVIVGAVHCFNAQYSPLSTPRPIVRSAIEDAERDEFLYGTFPTNFKWGTATSAYQIEGAWIIDGKGESIWDTFAHYNNGSNIADGSNGNVACDSYNKVEEDVRVMKAMGAHFYRFSIAWSRIIPTGRIEDGISQRGVNYYNRLIDELIANDIFPMATLYHWDLPQPLEDIGGWPNEEIAQHFGDYARVCFREFGDRVKHWITFNEPWVFCQLGYAYGSHAPGRNQNAPEEPYQCGHTLLKSHGLSYRIYQNEFLATQQGEVGITLNQGWSEPSDPTDPIQVEAAERSIQFSFGWFMNPLTRGEYPPVMRRLIDEKSAAEGLEYSRLPSFDDNWTAIINGTVDFIGLNHYTSGYVFDNVNNGQCGVDCDSNTGGYIDENWDTTGAPWLRVCPWGLRRILKWISDEYGFPIWVTESGVADLDIDAVIDGARVNYFMKYINEMMKAVVLDGANVVGYTAWSLIDNYEWAAGYTQRFGIHYIDWNDEELARVPKESALFLTRVFADNGFPRPSN